MTEKDLIKNLKQLKGIKPRKEWVILAKSEILSAEFAADKIAIKTGYKEKLLGIMDFLPSLISQRKLAYAFASVLMVFIGIFGFAQKTLPGDALFSVKKITEQSQAALTGASGFKNSVENFERRSQDLAKAVQDNRVNNIPSAVNEVKASIDSVAKNITINGSTITIKDVAEIVAKVKSFENNKTLGDISASQEIKDLNNALAPLVQREITALEKTTLTEYQQKTLDEVKKLYDTGNYSEALEKILLING